MAFYMVFLALSAHSLRGRGYLFKRAILPHEILGTPVAKYSFTCGANWISFSTPCLRFNFTQNLLR